MMTEATEAVPATTLNPEQVTAGATSSTATTTTKPKKILTGSREHQKLVAMVNEQQNKSNREIVEEILNRLTPDEQVQINRIAQMRVTEYYTLPGGQLDSLHRLFRRVITLNRNAFIQAANDEYQKMVAKLKAEAEAKQAEANVAEPPLTEATTTTDVVAAEP